MSSHDSGDQSLNLDIKINDGLIEYHACILFYDLFYVNYQQKKIQENCET